MAKGGCSCIAGRFDYSIDLVGKSQLKYTDLSDWMEQAPYVLPTKQQITIRKKDSSSPITLEVIPKATTVFSLSSLCEGGFTDGIYEICAYGCYNCMADTWGEKKYTKMVALYPSLQCQIDNLVAKGEEGAIENMNLLEALKCNVELGKTKEAASIEEIINTNLQGYNCKIC